MIEYIKHNWDAHNKWNAEKGDETHRINYPLDENSLVFDVGGYKGEWSDKIFQKYNPTIYIFEPVDEFFNEINSKFSENKKIKSFKFGLGHKSEILYIDLAGDSSSHVSDYGATKEKVEIKSLVDFLEQEKITKVDLIKINIEAAEFDLLDDIIKQKKATVFENIQVQFHTFIPDCVERRDSIRAELSKTHELTYDFTFIWENWKLK